MPLRNRVTPLSELVADPSKAATVFGNRGRLHDEQREIRRPHAGRAWIACRMRFRDRQREPMPPAGYTGLFFLDDATALAAGHRPCAQCRHADFVRFAGEWPHPLPQTKWAGVIDDRQHEERLTADGAQRHHEAAYDDLPDGAFVLRDAEPWLVLGERLHRWTPGGYDDPIARPSGERATVVTPASTVEVLRRGWRPEAVPFVHPSIS